MKGRSLKWLPQPGAVLLCMACWAGPAASATPALPGPLTLAAAIESALRQHPDLEALRHAAAAAAWQQQADAVYAAPELKLSTSRSPGAAADKPSERRQSIALQWDVPHLQAAEMRRASLAESAAASRLELARARQELVQKVRDVYQSLLGYTEEQRQAEATVQLRLQVLEGVNRQLRLGRATAIERVDAQTRWVEATQLRNKLQDERAKLGHRLDSLVGFRTAGLNLPDEGTFDALADLAVPPAFSAPELAQRADLQMLWARCKSTYLAEQDRVRQNDWGLKNVELSHTPASAGKASSTGVQLVLGLPLPGRTAATAAAAESAYLACQARARSALDQASRELQGWLSQYQMLRDSHLRQTGELLRLAAERLRLAHLSVQQGSLASADFLLARIAQAQAKQQAAVLLRQLRSTALEIELAQGAAQRPAGSEP